MHTDRTAPSSLNISAPGVPANSAVPGPALVPVTSVSNAPGGTRLLAASGCRHNYISLAIMYYGPELGASPSLQRDIDDATYANLDENALTWGVRPDMGAGSAPPRSSAINFSCPNLGLVSLLLALDTLETDRNQEGLPIKGKAQLDVLGWKMIMAIGASSVLDNEDAAKLRIASERHDCFSRKGKTLLTDIRAATAKASQTTALSMAIPGARP